MRDDQGSTEAIHGGLENTSWLFSQVHAFMSHVQHILTRVLALA